MNSQLYLCCGRKNLVFWNTACDSRTTSGKKHVMFGWRVTGTIKKYSSRYLREEKDPSKTTNQVGPREEQDNGSMVCQSTES